MGLRPHTTLCWNQPAGGRGLVFRKVPTHGIKIFVVSLVSNTWKEVGRQSSLDSCCSLTACECWSQEAAQVRIYCTLQGLANQLDAKYWQTGKHPDVDNGLHTFRWFGTMHVNDLIVAVNASQD